jgi:hypothetical protein
MESLFVSDVMPGGNGQSCELGAIYVARHARVRKDRLNIARENKTRPVAPIEECPEADVIAAAKEASSPVIPDREGKLAQQEVRAFLAPLCVSCQDQLAVVQGCVESERAKQFGAIVKLDIG